MSWFYAKGVNEDGEEYIDYSKCSQPENSLISVKAGDHSGVQDRQDPDA